MIILKLLSFKVKTDVLINFLLFIILLIWLLLSNFQTIINVIISCGLIIFILIDVIKKMISVKKLLLKRPDLIKLGLKGNNYYKAQDYYSALTYYFIIIKYSKGYDAELNAIYSKAILGIGNSYYSLNRFQDAIRYYCILDENRSHGLEEYKIPLICSYYILGYYDRCLELIQKKMNKKTIKNIDYMLGLIHEALGQPKLAISYYESSLLISKFPLIYFRLYILKKNNKDKNYRFFLNKAFECDSSNSYKRFKELNECEDIQYQNELYFLKESVFDDITLRHQLIFENFSDWAFD